MESLEKEQEAVVYERMYYYSFVQGTLRRLDLGGYFYYKNTHWGIQTMLQWVFCMQNLISNLPFGEGCTPVSRAGHSPRHSRDVIKQPYPDAEYDVECEGCGERSG